MSTYTPIVKRTDCGDGYGLAYVRKDTGEQLAVKVDLNKGDSTPDPRIILPDGTSEKVDASFVTKYEALKSGESLDPAEKEKVCKELKPADNSPSLLSRGLSHGGMTGALLLRGTSFFLEYKNYLPLIRIEGFDDNPMRVVALAGMIVTDFGGHALYVSLHDNVDPISRHVYDGLYGASALATAIHVGLGGGDASLQHSIQAFNTITSANVNTYAGDGWGSLYQLGLGGLELGLAFAVPVQPDVSEREAYVDSTTVTDHYQMRGNPYAGIRFPNLRTNFLRNGGSLVLWGGIQGMMHLVGADPDTMGKATAFNVDLLPSLDGRGLAGGAFTVDVGQLLGWSPPTSMMDYSSGVRVIN